MDGQNKEQICEFDVDPDQKENTTPGSETSKSGSKIITIINRIQHVNSAEKQNKESTDESQETTNTQIGDLSTASSNDITPVIKSAIKTNLDDIISEKDNTEQSENTEKNADSITDTIKQKYENFINLFQKNKDEKDIEVEESNQKTSEIEAKPFNFIKNELNKISNNFIKLLDYSKKQLSIEEQLLMVVTKIEKGLETDRLDAEEAEREQKDKRTDFRLPTEDKKEDKQGGLLSTLFNAFRAGGIAGLLGLIPGFDKLKGLISAITTGVGTLLGGLVKLVGVLTNPVFLSLAGIAAGIGLIAYELKLAKEMIDETNKLNRDTEKLNRQLTEQAAAGAKIQATKATQELTETGVVTRSTEANKSEAEYLEIKGKLEEKKSELSKQVRFFKVGRGAEAETLENEKYIQLEKEIKELEKQAEEKYQKTEQLKQEAGVSVTPEGDTVSKNPFRSSSGMSVAETLENAFYTSPYSKRKILAAAPESQSIGQTISDYFTDTYLPRNAPDNMKMSGNFGMPNFDGAETSYDYDGVPPQTQSVPLLTDEDIKLIKDGQKIQLQTETSDALTNNLTMMTKRQRDLEDYTKMWFEQNANTAGVPKYLQNPSMQNIDASTTIYESRTPYYRPVSDEIRRRN